MAENKTEEEILETDTVNEEASSAEEETKECYSFCVFRLVVLINLF